jgi:hypothetical protein
MTARSYAHRLAPPRGPPRRISQLPPHAAHPDSCNLARVTCLAGARFASRTPAALAWSPALRNSLADARCASRATRRTGQVPPHAAGIPQFTRWRSLRHAATRRARQVPGTRPGFWQFGSLALAPLSCAPLVPLVSYHRAPGHVATPGRREKFRLFRCHTSRKPKYSNLRLRGQCCALCCLPLRRQAGQIRLRRAHSPGSAIRPQPRAGCCT